MYAQQPAQMDPRSLAQQQGGPTPAIEKPRLQQQLDQLQKVLSAGHHAAVGIAIAVDRILGAVPQDSKDGKAPPPASTIEQRFAESIGSAEDLSERLHEALKRLNAAV